MVGHLQGFGCGIFALDNGRSFPGISPDSCYGFWRMGAGGGVTDFGFDSPFGLTLCCGGVFSARRNASSRRRSASKGGKKSGE